METLNERGLTDQNPLVVREKQEPPKKRGAKVVEWIKVILSFGKLLLELYNKI